MSSTEKTTSKILVAGGAGYIGSRLVPELIADGYDVTVIDLLWFGNNLPEECNVIEKDIFHVTVSDLERFDSVIFLGGLSNDPMAEFSPALNFISNGGSPAFLAFVAKQAGVKRFIYGSSCSVYGLASSDFVDESEIPNTEFPYGISKLQGEQGALQIADDNFSVISLRQGTLSGASPRMRFDILLNTMYMRAATFGEIVVNNPAIWRPILSIEDAMTAYKKAIEAEDRVSGVFNVASGNITVGEAADAVHKFFKDKYNKEVIMTVHSVPDKRNYRVSNKKASEVLGINFEGSPDAILEDLDKNIGLDFDFSNDANYNILIFKKISQDFSLKP